MNNPVPERSQESVFRRGGIGFLIHPFLFALAPSLFILANNIESSIFLDFWKPTLAIVGTAWAALFVLWPVFRNRDRAALILSTFLLLFFSFGQAYDSLGGRVWGFFDFKDPKTLGILWGVIFAGMIAVSFVFKKHLRTCTRFLNMAALSWIAISLVTIAGHEIRMARKGPLWTSAAAMVALGMNPPGGKPDIYYFIFDTYGRQDVLKEIYHYDNSGFLDGLKKMGFYVADRSMANYAFTALSIGSSLNMDYIHDSVTGASSSQDRRQLLHELNHNNKVMASLRQAGYEIVAFGSVYPETDFKEADIFFEYRHGKSEFYEILFAMTPLRWVSGLRNVLSPAESRRREALYYLEKIPEIAGIRAPTFAFVHFYPPRDPFIFGKNGEAIDEGEARFFLGRTLQPKYVPLYRGQVQFISGKILEMIREILKRSKEPPIIIIQGDHGPSFGVDWVQPSPENEKQRLSILNAYLLPGSGTDALYETISPVNSFRVIFNRYFGAGLPLLDDRSYFSEGAYAEQFKDVTASARSAAGQLPPK